MSAGSIARRPAPGQSGTAAGGRTAPASPLMFCLKRKHGKEGKNHVFFILRKQSINPFVLNNSLNSFGFVLK